MCESPGYTEPQGSGGNKAEDAVPFEWEVIEASTQRAKVYGGWIVRAFDDVVHDTPNGMSSGWDWRSTTVFIPDPKHQWKIKQEQTNV